MNTRKPQLREGEPTPVAEIPPGAKVLVLGSTSHVGVTAVPWEAPLPNVVDFHICVVIVGTLSDRLLAAKKGEYFQNLSLLLRRLLLSKGKVIVLSDEFSKVEKGTGYVSVTTNYDWCPFIVSLRSEQGDTVEIKGSRFPKYLGKLKRWSFHYECSEIDKAWSRTLTKTQQWDVLTQPLATNREGRLLAGCHRAGIYQGRPVTGAMEVYTHFPDTPTFTAGEFIFLPPLHDVDERERVALLLADLGLKEETPPPEWVEKIQVTVPGFATLSAEIGQALRAIRALEAKRDQLEADASTLKRWAQLLYASGAELEEIFRESLIALGGKVEAAKYAKEEYVLHTSSGEILVEVKGNTKSVSLDNVRQLMDYMLQYQRDAKKEGKGVLFGNAWRLLPPDERDTKDRPYFPEDVRQTATKFGIALLSSKEYFAIFCRFLAGEVKGQDILKKLAETNGVVTF